MKVAVSHAAAESPVSPAAWSQSAGKRLFDFVMGAALLLLVSPLMCVLALAIKAFSRGPVFFRQFRVGKDGREFPLIKFRTMTHAPRPGGPKVTQAGDPRVTPVGGLLRKWKLDELPQLLNVVRGEMSFVGPRPDVAEYINTLDHLQRARLLSMRPGLTGLATLHYRNEEEVLSHVPVRDLQRFYCQELLPQKVSLDWQYAERAGFLSDCKILLQTLKAIVV